MNKEQNMNRKNGRSKLLIIIVFHFLAIFEQHSAKAAENDLYDFLWLDPDKSVYVLQNKEFAKANTNYVNIGYLKGLSGDFQSTSGINMNAGHFFTEEWGAEIIYNRYNNKTNQSYENVRRVNGSVPFMRSIEQSYGAAAVWSPFYGKINTFNKIYYFDVNFSLGLLHVDSRSNAISATNRSSEAFSDESNTAVLAKIGFRFHVNKRIHLGVELQNTYFKAAGPIPADGKQLNTFSDALFKIGFSF